jgi:hypothetical protein
MPKQKKFSIKTYTKRLLHTDSDHVETFLPVFPPLRHNFAAITLNSLLNVNT